MLGLRCQALQGCTWVTPDKQLASTPRVSSPKSFQMPCLGARGSWLGYKHLCRDCWSKAKTCCKVAHAEAKAERCYEISCP